MKYEFENSKIVMKKAFAVSEVLDSVEKIFNDFNDKLPNNKNSVILLKANFNNDLNSLTGNSTDFRVIVAVAKALQKRGFNNIILGDGSNCGTVHAKLDILERLGVKKLAEYLRIKTVDLNYTPGISLYLSGKKAIVSELVKKADFIINLPKIKTHVEAKMTLSSKNLMGFLQGINKRVIHSNFIPNIYQLSSQIRPNLHIVDGLIAMEGDGPGDGLPVKMGVIVAGTDNFLVDAFCARISGFDPLDVPYVRLAFKKGRLSRADLKNVRENVDVVLKLQKPGEYVLTKLLLHNFFVLPRYWAVFDWIFNLKFVGTLLYKLNIRQDIYTDKIMNLKEFNYKFKSKEKAKVCEIYCPLGLKFNKDFNLKKSTCVECMYCYTLCPELFEVEGEMGFFKINFNRYKNKVKRLLS